MPLRGLKVLDLSDHAGALCSRLLGDLGAEVIRVEPPGGASVRFAGKMSGEQSLAHLYVNRGKHCRELDLSTDAGKRMLAALVEEADVIVDAGDSERGVLVDQAGMAERTWAHAVLLRVTPFGSTGPRRRWKGSDLVCAARAGMVFVNGHADDEPLAPFGLAAYAATGLAGAIAALLGLAARNRTGRGSFVDLSMVEATASAVEHVGGLFRQKGEIQRRQGTLHWSRTFRAEQVRDGFALLSHMGDWTTLSQWVAGECEEGELLLEREWEEVARRKECAPQLFDLLGRWASQYEVEDLCAQAQLRRLPFAAVREPAALARDPQLVARGFLERCKSSPGLVFPAAPFRFSACPRLPETSSQAPRSRAPTTTHGFSPKLSWPSPPPEPVGESLAPGARPLDGLVVLDFSWVVAGPVATRILADQGARVIKVEHRESGDYGTRRGGLTGNLNRGKQSIVLDMSREAGRRVARDLAAVADVVLDNFSARVMGEWGLDYASLCKRRHDIIAVRMTGFGLDGPLRDGVSYGPTLQALVGYPHLMRQPDGPPSGWGYSWSDMAAGASAALATLAALAHRSRTGEGQLVDLSQYENLISLLGPHVLELLAGHAVEPFGNASQEGARLPHGLLRCAPGVLAGEEDDDRWLALSVQDDDAWARLAALLSHDGEAWASDPGLGSLPGREARRGELEGGLARWARGQVAEELEERLQSRGIAAGLVAHGADLMQDPHLAARGYFASARDSGGETSIFDGVPFHASNMPGRVASPGPERGQHSDQVLSDLLGLATEEIDALRAQGVLG